MDDDHVDIKQQDMSLESYTVTNELKSWVTDPLLEVFFRSSEVVISNNDLENNKLIKMCTKHKRHVGFVECRHIYKPHSSRFP